MSGESPFFDFFFVLAVEVFFAVLVLFVDVVEVVSLLDRGVDGVMTDRTDILKEVLVQRHQWMSDGREHR